MIAPSRLRGTRSTSGRGSRSDGSGAGGRGSSRRSRRAGTRGRAPAIGGAASVVTDTRAGRGAHVAVRVDRRDREPVARGRRQVARPHPAPAHLAHRHAVAKDAVAGDAPASAGAADHDRRTPESVTRRFSRPGRPGGRCRLTTFTTPLFELSATPRVGRRDTVDVQPGDPHSQREAAHRPVRPAVPVHAIPGKGVSPDGARDHTRRALPGRTSAIARPVGFSRHRTCAGWKRPGLRPQPQQAAGCRIAAPPASSSTGLDGRQPRTSLRRGRMA